LDASTDTSEFPRTNGFEASKLLPLSVVLPPPNTVPSITREALVISVSVPSAATQPI